jgi:hypothetical protein
MAVDLKNSLEKLQARTKAGKLRALMPIIEAKTREGIRHVDIIRLLNDQGLAISEYTYRSYLQRYREKQAAAGRPSAGRAQAAASPSTEPRESTDRRPPTFDYDPRGIPDLLK